jgi:signal transduction histidine kinase
MSFRGLRVRIAALFVGGALALSLGLAMASYEITRHNVLRERERTAVRATYFDAAVVRPAALSEDADLVDALRALDTGQTRRPLIRRDGAFYARAADDGLTRAVPPALLHMVESGVPAVQRVRASGVPLLVVGVPLSSSGTGFFEVQSLAEAQDSLRNLAATLAGVAAAATAAAAVLSIWVARGVLRPLTAVARHARQVSGGDLSTRMPLSPDPELAPVTEAFNAMVEDVARRIDRERRFTADVSHELRSPLQTLSSASQVLRNRLDQLDEGGRSAALLVAQEAERFNELVQSLIKLARADQPVQLREIDVMAVIREVAARLQVPPGRIKGPRTLAWQVEPDRLMQILDNLVRNANAYGGGVETISCSVEGSTLRIMVDDAGPGIPFDDRVIVFDRFSRGRGSSIRDGAEGVGLGLAIVAEHVAGHRGRVRVTDRPGGGCRVVVELPGRVA